MNKEEIKLELGRLKEVVLKANKNIAKLELELKDAAETFEEKFQIWWGSDNKDSQDWLISKDDYPMTRKWFEDNYEWDRYKTYIIDEWLEEEFQFLTDPEQYESDIKDYPTYKLSDERKTQLRAMAKELMETNLGEFTCDW